MTTSATALALDQQERDIKAASRAASDQRSRAALLLAHNPGDTQAQQELAELERELAGYRTDLERIMLARQALAAVEVADDHEARSLRLEEARATALAGMADRVTAATKVEKAFKELEAALVAEAHAALVVRDAAIQAGRLLHPSCVLDAVGVLHDVEASLNPQGPALSALNRVLRTAAEAGHKLGQSVQIVGLSDPQPSPSVDAKAGAERVALTASRWSLQPSAVAS